MPQSTQSGAPYFRPQAQTAATLPPQQMQRMAGGLDRGQYLQVQQELIQRGIDSTEKATQQAGGKDDEEAAQVGVLNSWQKSDQEKKE